MNKKIVALIIAVISMVALAGGGYLYWNKKPKTVEPQSRQSSDSKNIDDTKVTETENRITRDEIEDNAVKEISSLIQTNPLEKKPDLNPIDKTNPYKDIRINPFK